ncbi:MAG: hypothetical protein MGF17_13355 [Trichodesmium sp. MAG_R04]|nr:hypothetical protein [Trichodesmium sp. MAG_R04]
MNNEAMGRKRLAVDVFYSEDEEGKVISSANSYKSIVIMVEAVLIY